MNFEEMTNSELTEFIKSKGGTVGRNLKKDELIELAKTFEEEVAEVVDEEKEETQSLTETIQSAKVTSETAEAKEDTKSMTLSKPYHLLSSAERNIIRSRADEYESAESGQDYTVTDRLSAPHHILKTSVGYRKFVAGATYKLLEDDLVLVEATDVRVKTEATKDLCCGKAEYENVRLFNE